MATIDNAESVLHPASFWSQLSVEQRRSLITAVTTAISTGADTSLADIARAAGLRTRTLRHHFSGRRRLFSDVVKTVVSRARRVARGHGPSPYTTSAVIESLVWRRVAAYEMVSPVVRAVFERGIGDDWFGSLCAALRSESDYQLERICTEAGPADEHLRTAIDATLSLHRIDRLRRGDGRDIADVSAELNEDIRVLFAGRGVRYVGNGDHTSCGDLINGVPDLVLMSAC